MFERCIHSSTEMKLLTKGNLFHHELQVVVWDYGRKEHAHHLQFKISLGARFGSTYTKIGTIQRRLAWSLRKDDTQIREVFHIFGIQGSAAGSASSISSKLKPFTGYFEG